MKVYNVVIHCIRGVIYCNTRKVSKVFAMLMIEE